MITSGKLGSQGMKQLLISAVLGFLAVGAMATPPVLGESDPHPDKFTIHNALWLELERATTHP